jgi:ATP-dependent Clp protease ATP-binding subunit ClpA
LDGVRLTVAQLRNAITPSAVTEVTERPPIAKRIVEAAFVQARDLQHAEVGTGHLLLAILSMPECDAALRLQQLGHQLAGIRSQTLSVVKSPDAS